MLRKSKTKWLDEMRRRGHKPILTEDGDLDIFANASYGHNGPACSVCGWKTCWHCSNVKDIPVCEAHK